MDFKSIGAFCDSLEIPKSDSIRSILAEHEFLTGLFRKTGSLTARVNKLKTKLLTRFGTIPGFKSEYKALLVEHYLKGINQTSQSFTSIPVIKIQRPIAIRIAPPAIAISPDHSDDDPNQEILEIDVPELSREDVEHQVVDMFELWMKMMKLRGEAHVQKVTRVEKCKMID